MSIKWQIISVIIFIYLQSCADGEVSMSGSQGATQKAHSHLNPQADDAQGVIRGDSPNEVGVVVEAEGSSAVADSVARANERPSESSQIENETGAEDIALLEPPAGNEPADLEFLCLSPSVVIKSTESILLSWQLPRADAILTVELANDAMGSLVSESANSVSYFAPDMVTQSQSLAIIGRIEDLGLEASCTVQIQADQDLGVQDDGFVEGLVGKVYQLPTNTSRLPDFSRMIHQSEIVVRNLDIPNRAFDAGFPGAENLIEWFGIQFMGRIKVETAGEYDFQLSSDDGANLYINGQKVVDNDGTHAVQAKSGKIYLGEGEHDIRVDYFQGPRYHIALQLFWRQSGQGSFKIIGAEHFTRPKPSSMP